MGRYLRDGGEENEGESGSQGYLELCLAGPAADPQVTYKSPRRGIGSDGVRIRVNQVFEEGLGSRATKRARTISSQQGPRFLGISCDKVPDKLKPERDLKSTVKAENTEYLLYCVTRMHVLAWVPCELNHAERPCQGPERGAQMP